MVSLPGLQAGGYEFWESSTALSGWVFIVNHGSLRPKGNVLQFVIDFLSNTPELPYKFVDTFLIFTRRLGD